MSDSPDRQDGVPLEIEVEGLRKTFGRREVLKGLSFSLERGGFLSIFGPNGAGKTTTLRVLATLLTAGAGTVRVAGHDVREDPMPVRRTIGFISHNPMLYLDLTAEENLRFYADMYGVDGPRGAHHGAARAPRAQPPPPRRRAHLQQGHAPAPRHRARHPPPAARAAAGRAALRPRPARRRHPRRPAHRDPRRAHLRDGHAQHRQGPRVGHAPHDHRERPHRLRARGRRRPRRRSAPSIASTSRKARCSERAAPVHGHPAQGPHPRAAHPRDAHQHDPLRAAGDGDLPLRLHA